MANTYFIRYSPGIIFSGEVRGLDVNFFNPLDEQVAIEIDGDWRDVGDFDLKDSALRTQYGFNPNTTAIKEFTTDGEIDFLGKLGFQFNAQNRHFVYEWKDERNGRTYTYMLINTVADGHAGSIAAFLDNIFQKGIDEIQDKLGTSWTLYEFESINRVVTENGEPKVIKSSAETLQDTVATWYKVLRAISLVGLLSVLVYIGIRILISSTGQEKAKYKKMIGDWVVAICILFVLQYIMVFTLEITERITDVLNQEVMGEEGEDLIMSDLRTQVGDSEDFETMFPQTLMYLVLVIYTVIFTIQYLKRLLYMAFFTLIAPLIALTYPLDKIKDGQAQAFTMWTREYIFNALLQPMHLLLYYIFVESAMELVYQNPLYAVVAIGFLVPAEKFFRKMFGFEKATSAGQIGAAAGGALIMNAINKMGQRAGKAAAGKGGNTSDSGGGSGGSTPRYISGPGGGSSTSTGSGPSNPPRDNNGNPIGTAGNAFGQSVSAAPTRGASNPSSGLKTLSGHYFNRGNFGKQGKVWKAVGRGIRKGAVGAVGAATLGTVGLAAGIATGDLGNALKYGAAGAGVGYMGANSVGDKLTDIEKTNREIYKEGALGSEEYNTRNSIKELTNDSDFNRVCKQLGVTDQKGRESLIRQFHSNGITKSEDIKKAMNVRAQNPGTNQNEIIAAQKIRQEAERYGMKKKDIIDSLRSKGLNQSQVDRAMNLLDQL